MTINVIPGAYKAREISNTASVKLGLEVFHTVFSRSVVQNEIEKAANLGKYICDIESPVLSDKVASITHKKVLDYWGKLLTNLGYVVKINCLKLENQNSKVLLIIEWSEAVI